MSVQTELLTEIEAFLAQRKGMAETTFGKLAVNDGKFVRRLRDGCNMTLATIDRVRTFLRQHGANDASAQQRPKPRPKRARSPEPQASQDEQAA